MALFWALALAVVSPTPAQVPSPKVAPSATSRHKVQVNDPAVASRLAAQGARLIADYGGFQLYDASAAAAASLGGNTELRDNYNTILLNAAHLDTSLPAVQSLRKSVAAFSGKRMHLIQFAGPVQPAWRDSLLQSGAQIIAYVPQNTYLVYGDAPAIAQIQSVAAHAPHIQWEGAYQDDYKIHPAAKAVDAKGNARKIGTDLFAIQMVADAAPNAETLQLLDGLKLEPLRRQQYALRYLNVVGRFAAGDLPRIAAQPDVVSILPYFTPKKLDERQDQIVAGNLSGSIPSEPGYLAWLTSKGFTQAQFDASGFAVDVSDSGIDDGTTTPNHFGLYISGQLGGTNSRVIYSRLEGSPNSGSTLKGCDGHGTINAHIVGGYDNGAGFPFADSTGYHYGLGVCPFVHLGGSVVFDPDNWTNPDYPTLASAAYRSGSRIINNSWGGADGVYDSDAQTYDALVRDADSGALGNQEIVMVFAAGNDGPGAETVTSPASAKNVIAVGASDGVQPFGGLDGCGTADADADDANKISSFSSRGPTDDGRHKPDLMAPGTHISGGVIQIANPGTDGTADPCFASDASGVCGGLGADLFWPASQQFYTASSGTSHSTPAVSGGCALVRQYFINNGWTPPSAAMTKAFLMNSARYLTGSGGNDTLWSDTQGMGEMDLGAAFDGTARILEDELPANIFTASGQTRTFAGVVADSTKPFRVTLAWTDAPGSTTGSAANNDLDLTVTIGGNTYKGNVFNGAFSTVGGSADTVNNVESVYLPAGVSGNFTVTVTAANINSVGVPNNNDSLEQDFALVVYNANGIEISGATLLAESCTPTNGVIDPGETVTVNFALQNGGVFNVTNLVATLLQTNGVNLPDGPKTVALLVAGGAAVNVPFTFTADGSCGGTVTAVIALQTGSINLGPASYTFPLGRLIHTPLFSDNFDGVTVPALPSLWTTDVTGGQKPWVTENTNGTVDTSPNAAFCAATPNIGVGELISPVIAVQGLAAQLSFRQSFNLEANFDASVAYDGGVLEIQIGNGAFTDILAAGGSFISGGYNMTISSSEGANNNPLAGRQAWSGISGPYSTNSYITTIVQLPTTAAGQNIQLKWRCGTDAGNQLGSVGWWVDTVAVHDGVYSCCNGAEVVEPEIISPNDGLQTTSTTIPVSGNAIPGLTLTLFDNGATNTSFVVAPSGVFSVNVALDYGTNVLTALQSQAGTNISSQAVAVILPLPSPTLHFPANSAPSVAFMENGLSNAIVNLYDGTPTVGTLIATFTNDASGNFSGMVTLANGAHSLTATETAFGLTSLASVAATVNVLTVSPPTILSPVSGLVSTNPSVTVTGTGTSGALLTIFNGTNLIASTTVNSAGNFSIPLNPGNGSNSLTAIQAIGGVSGPFSAAVQIQLTLAPMIVVQPQDQKMYLEGKVAFASSATGATPLSYFWQKDGTNIAGATSTTLTLAAITASSAASYSMVAGNSYGTATSAVATLSIIPNPFTGLTGLYYGLFSETPAQFQSSGLLTLSLTSLGAYSGRIVSAGGAYIFTGTFSSAGQAVQSVSRGASQTPLTLSLALDLTNGTEQILGTVSNANWVAALEVNRATYTAAAPAPEKGNYTMLFGGSSDGGLSPGGDGYARVIVVPTGLIVLNGFLPDNTPCVAFPASVSKYGRWPLYMPLYGTEGSLSGWITFTNLPGVSFVGNAAWFRTNSSGRLYPHGFTNYLTITGSTFSPGNAHVPVLGVTNNLQIILSQGNLPVPLTNEASLLPGGRLLTNGPGIPNLLLLLSPSTGILTGSFTDPATGLPTQIRGMVLQQQTNAGGYFVSTNVTGTFQITLP